MITVRKVAFGAGLFLCVALAVAAVFWWVFVQSFGASPMAADFSTLLQFVTFAKKTGADLVVIKQPPLAPWNAPGYSSERIEADAKLFDMWSTAVQLSSAVLENGPAGDWVRSSSELEGAKVDSKTDPWGHSICLLRRDGLVLVISAGPGAPSSPNCKNIHMTADELAKFPRRKLLQSPSGSLVLVADKASPIKKAFATP